MSVSVNNQKTIQQIIDSTSAKASERKTGELGKDEFLNLLITQLRYQDPMNPVDDKEFIGQMAQFSALEQMQNLNGTFSSTKAFGMIGKHITASIVDEVTKEVSVIKGIAQSVKLEGGKTSLVVNGMDIPVEKVTDVSNEDQAVNQSNLSQYTGLIGYDVKGCVYDSETADIVEISGNVREIQKGAYENYALLDGVSVRVHGINTSFSSRDPEFSKQYLEESIGMEVPLIISSNGKQVPVNGVLKEFNINRDGSINAILDGVKASVDSIFSVKNPYLEP